MKKIKLKICGLCYSDNVYEVLKINPDFIGFIFYEGSPRFVGNHYGWIRNLNIGPHADKVAVFVNESAERIIEISEKTNVQYIQLHGNEPPELCGELTNKGLKLIKVFSVGEDFSFKMMEYYIGIADYFLFDTKGKYLGGSGISFDWNLIEKYPFNIPFFLSGGIGIENISNIRHLNNPMLFAVDVNSKLESFPGIKDSVKLGKFKEEFEKLHYD